MEQKRSVWKETLNYGIIYGLITVGLSLLAYMFDLTFKTWIVWPSLLFGVLVLFFQLRYKQGLQRKDPLRLWFFFHLIKERIAFLHYEQ